VLKAALITGKQQAKQAREDHARVAAAEVMDALVNFNQVVGRNVSQIPGRPSGTDSAIERRRSYREAAFQLMKTASSRAPLITEDAVAFAALEASTAIGRWFGADALLWKRAPADATHEYVIYATTQVGSWLKGEPIAPHVEAPDLTDEDACRAWKAPARPAPKTPKRLQIRRRK
jgi:hypothetical protein